MNSPHLSPRPKIAKSDFILPRINAPIGKREGPLGIRDLSFTTLRPTEGKEALLRSKERSFDRVGVGISAACAIKCIALPIVAASAPAFSALAALSHNSKLLWAITALAIPFAIRQLVVGGVRLRKLVLPVSGISGISLMLLGALGHTPKDTASTTPLRGTPDDPICSSSTSQHTPGHTAHMAYLSGGLILGMGHAYRLREKASKA